MRGMRLVIRLALPVGLVVGAAGVTMAVHLASGTSYCATWLSAIMPYCW